MKFRFINKNIIKNFSKETLSNEPEIDLKLLKP